METGKAASGVSYEATLPDEHPTWNAAERRLYGNALMRVLGETDHKGNVLIELLSGELEGCRIWIAPEALQRTEGAAT